MNTGVSTRRQLASSLVFCGALGLTLGVAMPGPWASEPPVADGETLRADQFPRFLPPTHDAEFGFDPFVVVGDHAQVTFERLGGASGVETEIWDRVETGAVGGRVVSLFRPIWSPDELQGALRGVRWGVDRPFVRWGDLLRPDGTRQSVHLRLTPTRMPEFEVAVVNEAVQYTSHAVNLWIPDFGDGRLAADTDAWDLSTVTQRFYEHFADEYETLAIVTQTMQPMAAMHRNVQNAVAGIGLPLFDDSARYGSASVLQGVEVFAAGHWADAASVLHQQAHQWSDYSQAWAQAGITRMGHDPTRHTPLLTPGPVMAGAVLEATRHVERDAEGDLVVARTQPTIAYSPLTLYRMGLAAPGELPVYEVFTDQGQFDPNGRSAPPIGTVVAGGRVQVTAEDFVAADGIRNGPAMSSIRRALVYVSRNGLASQEEMDVVSYFGARLGAAAGVTTWEGYPSFVEATSGRGAMATAIVPAPGSGRAALSPPIDVTDADVPADVLVGVELDQPVPGRLAAGATVTLEGSLTLTDRTDYNIVCFRFIRYGAEDVNEIFVCGTLERTRFSVPVTFSESQRGRYTIEAFAFWTDSGPQTALSRYGVIVVE